MPKKVDDKALAQKMLDLLRDREHATSREIGAWLKVSQPVVSRLVAQQRDELVMVGRARATRYAALRSIPDVASSHPLFEVNPDATTRRVATLHAIKTREFYVEAEVDDFNGGFFPDLPYFLYDQRPAGFLGRLLPRQYPELRLPQDILLWSGDDCLRYLLRHGWNAPGSLVVGEAAFAGYMESLLRPAAAATDVRRLYPRLAENVLASGPAGSSAGGEQAKFLAVRAPGRRAVLVKFSPPGKDPIAMRVKDLLVCEHLAHGVLQKHGQSAATSALITAGHRVFLEVDRFDRLPNGGRRGVASLTALDAEWVGGDPHDWPGTTRALCKQGIVSDGLLADVRWLYLFGQLIANTDMHGGNLSFICHGTRILSVAPAYDMLPMLYAPQQNDLPTRTFAPPLPKPSDADLWPTVGAAASLFWETVARHPEISPGFCKLASANCKNLKTVRRLAAKLPGAHESSQ